MEFLVRVSILGLIAIIVSGCGTNPSSEVAKATSYASREGNDVIDKAQNGESFAQFVMGYSYEVGKNKVQDYDKAAFWYAKAADQGLARAQYRLALLNMMGVIDKRPRSTRNRRMYDEKRTKDAINLYRAAGFQGYAPAQYELGVLYTGVNPIGKVDLVEAYAWLNIVASGKGDDSADAKGRMIDVMVKIGGDDMLQKAFERAREYKSKISIN